jgi:hypothetical protein
MMSPQAPSWKQEARQDAPPAPAESGEETQPGTGETKPEDSGEKQ